MLSRFHPLISTWFAERFEHPTAPQLDGWKHISDGRDTLISAPTGSGKTLAAFLWALDTLVCRAAASTLEDRIYVVYVSPLKALSNDIQKNLQEPLQGIRRIAERQGVPPPEIRVAVRTGDTSQQDRARMVKRPPHILITTPESLYILLTARRSREALQTAEFVIVDEIHAVAQDKRGSHLALSLERLDALVGRPLQRIGLSATQKPIDMVAALLVGGGRFNAEASPVCAIVDAGHKRLMDLTIDICDQELGPIATHELMSEVYDRMADHIRAHRTTLVFVNTRRQVERVSRELSQRLGEEKVAAHHGSLSRQTRLEAEQRLKAGEVSTVVSTASLELGIDIGHVDLVCHLGAPRSLSTLLQRIGRSGHWLGAVPKGIMYPLTRDELVQTAAAIWAIRAGELDRLEIPELARDILAQQMVATVASVTTYGDTLKVSLDPSSRDTFNVSLELPEDDFSGGITETELFDMLRRAYPYRRLTREQFEVILEVLTEGISGRKGRRSAWLHRDRVNGHLWGRRGARMAAITNGGAIPDAADYDVIELPAETFVGKINEDFAIESLAGDVFTLGNRSWRIQRVSSGKVFVEDAHGMPPSIPFWLGEAPSRTEALSIYVGGLRERVAGLAPQEAEAWLQAETGVPLAGAQQIVQYIRETLAALGCVPSTECVVAERFFDEAGGMQLVIHSPFGGRINRAWGLALRKRFCVSFDIELQAAATDDGLVISLNEQHSFPLETVFSFVRNATLKDDLLQALLVSPMFTNRWRWNATRSLALLRFARGRKVPMQIVRMQAEDLLGAVFPEQIMCQDNRSGPVVPPDHPLVNETIENCLSEAMDLVGLRRLIGRVEGREIRLVTAETSAPSPMSHEILNANPYAFLDDAPLEERRTRAVSLRRTDPSLATSMGSLNAAAILEVKQQAWPHVRDANELHDLLLGLIILPTEQMGDWHPLAQALMASRRAAVARWTGGAALVAAERVRLLRTLQPDLQIDVADVSPLRTEAPPTEELAVRTIVHGWMDVLGPVTVQELAERCGLTPEHAEQGLLALQTEGAVMQGRFTPGQDALEWCERGLLARIHRLTLGQLRQEIQPVSPADFIRFLLRWQHVQPRTQLHGRDGVLQIVGQLQGLELPAPAWEESVLRGRISRYDPEDLEYLCLSGRVTWGRLRLISRPDEEDANDDGARKRPGITRMVPIGLMWREALPFWLEVPESEWEPLESVSSGARGVALFLQQHGASFLSDIARGVAMPISWVEEALWELVGRGLVTGDGIAGLRSLMGSQSKRKLTRHGLRGVSQGRSAQRFMPVGRWSLWRPPDLGDPQAALETRARQFLKRYGVVFRELLARERGAPPWRLLLQVYRRWEAQGELRGGRFVSTFIGEQYALPEAVESLRSVRRTHTEEELVVVPAADPLNLVGILTPGPRVSPYSQQAILYRDGVPIDAGPRGAIQVSLSRLRVPVPR